MSQLLSQIKADSSRISSTSVTHSKCSATTVKRLLCRTASLMTSMLISLQIYLINRFIIFVALNGFVCTYKIHAEEECLFSKVWCYECDSQVDPYCADPFDSVQPQDVMDASTTNLAITTTTTTTDTAISTTATTATAATATLQPTTVPLVASTIAPSISLSLNNQTTSSSISNSSAIPISKEKETNNTMIEITTNRHLEHQQPKPAWNRPRLQRCHGCCVKITSRTNQGIKYVKRTCTSNLQINFFMVDHVCMKESGNRGSMCFCETNYCNGKQSSQLIRPYLIETMVMLASAFTIYTNSMANRYLHYPTTKL